MATPVATDPGQADQPAAPPIAARDVTAQAPVVARDPAAAPPLPAPPSAALPLPGQPGAVAGGPPQAPLAAPLADVPAAGPASDRPPAPAWMLRPTRRRSRKRSVLVLAGMLLACAVLATTAAILALKGVRIGNAADASMTGQLAQVPPGLAGGLPLRSSVVGNEGARRAITQFRRRFDELLELPATGEAAGLYSEPGRVDPVTNAAAWIIYLGVNIPDRQADPAASLARLMAGLAGPTAHDQPWLVHPGAAGGVAECVITVLSHTQAAICGWATNWTIGALMSPTRDTTVTELGYLMGLMRPDLLQH